MREGSELSVRSEVSFKITKMGVDLYKYFAKSEENYEKGIFSSFSSKTKQNKKETPSGEEVRSSQSQVLLTPACRNGATCNVQDGVPILSTAESASANCLEASVCRPAVAYRPNIRGNHLGSHQCTKSTYDVINGTVYSPTWQYLQSKTVQPPS